MAEVAIIVAGEDITEHVLFSSARFRSLVNGKAGEASMRVRDLDGTRSFAIGSDWLLAIDGAAVWRGFVTEVQRVYVFPAENPAETGLRRFFDVKGADLNILFDKRVVYNKANPKVVEGTQFPAGTDDTVAITELIQRWLDLSHDDLDVTSGVTNVGQVDPEETSRAWSGGWLWGQAMASIATLPVAVWYIRPEVGSPKGMLVYVDQDEPDAPFGLSDMGSSSQPPVIWQDQGPAASWTASHAYVEVDLIAAIDTIWYANNDGESGSSEPDWDVDAQPVVDNEIEWYVYAYWAPGAYPGGTTIQPTVFNGHSYIAIQGGVDPGPEPDWPTDGGTVTSSMAPADFVGTYREMEITLDGTGLANDVMGWGMGYGSQTPVFRRLADDNSISHHGIWQQGLVATGVYKQGTINRMVDSIVNGSPFSLRGAKDDRIAIRLTTYISGLLAGYVVNFESRVWDYSISIPIRQLDVSFEAPDNPRYDLLLSFDIDTPWSFIDNFLVRFPRLPGLPGNPQWPGLPQQQSDCRECMTPTGPEIVEVDVEVTDLFAPDQFWHVFQTVRETGTTEDVTGPEPSDGTMFTGIGVNIYDLDPDPPLWEWGRYREFLEWNNLPSTTVRVKLISTTVPRTSTIVETYPDDGTYIVDGNVVISGFWVIEKVDFVGDPTFGTSGPQIASFVALFAAEPQLRPIVVPGSFQDRHDGIPLAYDFSHSGDDKFQIAIGTTSEIVSMVNTDFDNIFEPPPHHVVGLQTSFGEFDRFNNYPTAGFNNFGAGGSFGGEVRGVLLSATYMDGTQDVQEFTVASYEPGSLRITQGNDPFVDFVESDPAGGKFQVPLDVDTTGIVACYTKADCVPTVITTPGAPSSWGCSNAIRSNSTTYTTVTRYQPHATLVFVNGLLQLRDVAYTEDADRVTLHFVDPVDSDVVVRVCYFAEVSIQ